MDDLIESFERVWCGRFWCGGGGYSPRNVIGIQDIMVFDICNTVLYSVRPLINRRVTCVLTVLYGLLCVVFSLWHVKIGTVLKFFT